MFNNIRFDGGASRPSTQREKLQAGAFQAGLIVPPKKPTTKPRNSKIYENAPTVKLPTQQPAVNDILDPNALKQRAIANKAKELNSTAIPVTSQSTPSATTNQIPNQVPNQATTTPFNPNSHVDANGNMPTQVLSAMHAIAQAKYNFENAKTDQERKQASAMAKEARALLGDQNFGSDLNAKSFSEKYGVGYQPVTVKDGKVYSGDTVVHDNGAQTNQTPTTTISNQGSPTQLAPNNLSFMDSLRKSIESQFEGQKSMLDASRTNQLTQVEKAYADAVNAGRMSVREAQEAFRQQSEMINQDTYQNSEETNLLATQRGLGNSQQMLGMQASDQSRAMGLNNNNKVNRDNRVSSIRDRINTLTTHRDLDKTRINEMYDANLRQARSQADASFNDKSFQVGFDDHQANRDFGFQNQLMDKQFGFQNQMADKQQGFDLEKMKLNQQQDLEKMKIGNDYDLEKMKSGHNLDLDKMAVQFGYQSSLQQSEFKARAEQAIQQQKFQVEAMEKEYEVARSRELAKYTKGTKEYQIREAQLKDALNQKIQEIDWQTRYKIQTDNMINSLPDGTPQAPEASWYDLYLPSTFGGLNYSDTAKALRGEPTNDEEMSKYNAQMEAIRRYNEWLEKGYQP
jgi:hypothetical protein